MPSRAASRRRASREEIGEIARGEAWGCMDITEPNAGSDMAALRTRGRAGREGRLVRHRPEDLHHLGPRQVPLRHRAHRGRRRTRTTRSPGLDGLSMFFVKTYDDLPDGTRKRYVTLERIEEKLGHHGVGHRGALVRARPGAPHRQARRGLQVHARAHEQRPRRRRVREHRARARRPTAWPRRTPRSAARWARPSPATR